MSNVENILIILFCFKKHDHIGKLMPFNQNNISLKGVAGSYPEPEANFNFSRRKQDVCDGSKPRDIIVAAENKQVQSEVIHTKVPMNLSVTCTA